MIGLTGARVIIVDDDKEEALPILKAFAKKGIPVAFFDGNLDEVPEQSHRLFGVRLAILDMDLVGGGVSDKSKVSTLVNYIGKIMSPNNGPYAVLAWTRHSELLELFKKELFLAKNIPNPILMVMVTKDECKNQSGDFDLALVSGKIEEALKQFSPLRLLQAWEEKCFMAATDVTNKLSGLAAGNAADLEGWRNLWKSQLLRLMHTMAKAEAGKHLDGNSCLNALYGSLNPLHADRMESNIAELCNSLSDNSAEIMEAKQDCGPESRAKVNSMLHLSLEDVERFYAGNIYKYSAKRKPRWAPSSDALLDDIIKPEKAELKPGLSTVSTPVLIEVSATCDHAQRNIRIARFIAGLVIPASESRNIKGEGNFIWRFGPVFLQRPIASAGQYYFYFSARHVVTLDLEQTAKLKAVARLRGQALVHLQAWFAHQSARPGMLLL